MKISDKRQEEYNNIQLSKKLMLIYSDSNSKNNTECACPQPYRVRKTVGIDYSPDYLRCAYYKTRFITVQI